MSSSHDENRRAELNGTEPEGEELSPAMAQHNAIYDPGPSFVEHDRPTVRLAELPAWLQRFAASAGDPDDELQEAEEINQSEDITQLPTAMVEGESEPEIEPEAPAIDLPSWLDDDEAEIPLPAIEPAIPETPAVAEEPLPGSPQFMISEDDLPDWLRTISADDGGDESSAASVSADSMAVAGLASVPSVARAWVTRDDMDALSEGGSLFALVASQSSSTPTHVATAAPQPQPEPESRRRRGRANDSAAADNATATAVAEVPAEKDAPSAAAVDEQATERNFKLLPVLVGALLVVVIVLLAINFVL